MIMDKVGEELSGIKLLWFNIDSVVVEFEFDLVDVVLLGASSVVLMTSRRWHAEQLCITRLASGGPPVGLIDISLHSQWDTVSNSKWKAMYINIGKLFVFAVFVHSFTLPEDMVSGVDWLVAVFANSMAINS